MAFTNLVRAMYFMIDLANRSEASRERFGTASYSEKFSVGTIAT